MGWVWAPPQPSQSDGLQLEAWEQKEISHRNRFGHSSNNYRTMMMMCSSSPSRSLVANVLLSSSDSSRSRGHVSFRACRFCPCSRRHFLVSSVLPTLPANACDPMVRFFNHIPSTWEYCICVYTLKGRFPSPFLFSLFFVARSSSQITKMVVTTTYRSL